MGKKDIPLVRTRGGDQTNRQTNVRNIANLAQLTLKQKQESSERKLNTWIESNLMMKEVVDFDDDDDDDGEIEIEEVPTTCYGDVEFRGATRRSCAKFVRFSPNTQVKI